MLDRWVVVVSGADMNEELRKVPDTHVSFAQAADEVSLMSCVIILFFLYSSARLTMCEWYAMSQFLYMKHTVAPDVTTHPIHTPVIRGPLTRNLNSLFPDIIDEMKTAFPDVMPSPTKDGGMYHSGRMHHLRVVYSSCLGQNG